MPPPFEADDPTLQKFKQKVSDPACVWVGALDSFFHPYLDVTGHPPMLRYIWKETSKGCQKRGLHVIPRVHTLIKYAVCMHVACMFCIRGFVFLPPWHAFCIHVLLSTGAQKDIVEGQACWKMFEKVTKILRFAWICLSEGPSLEFSSKDRGGFKSWCFLSVGNQERRAFHGKKTVYIILYNTYIYIQYIHEHCSFLA